MQPIGLKFYRRENRLMYLVFDPKTREAMAIDAHPELIDDFRGYIADHSLKLKWVFETQAWDESASAILGGQYGAKASDALTLGSFSFEAQPAPGLVPGAKVLVGAGLLFSGQAILPGSQVPLIVRDDAQLRAFREKLLAVLPPQTIVYPSVDRLEILCTTVGLERSSRSDSGAGVSGISVEKYAAKVSNPQADTAYVDVRDPDEFDEGHAAGTRNIPLSEIGFHLEELLRYRHVYVNCGGGKRGQLAAKTLAYWGALDVVHVSGGFQAWFKAGLPVKKGDR